MKRHVTILTSIAGTLALSGGALLLTGCEDYYEEPQTLEPNEQPQPLEDGQTEEYAPIPGQEPAQTTPPETSPDMTPPEDTAPQTTPPDGMGESIPDTDSTDPATPAPEPETESEF